MLQLSRLAVPLVLAVTALAAGGVSALTSAATSDSASATGPTYPLDCCAYKFASPTLPGVVLPPAQPNSPGDLNLMSYTATTTGDQSGANNMIVDLNGNSVQCNGNYASVWDTQNSKWWTSYVGDDQQTHDYDHVFYITQSNQLWLSTLQTWQQDMRTNLMAGKLVQIDLQCQSQSTVNQCVQFWVGGTTPSPLVTSRPNCLQSGSGSTSPSESTPEPAVDANPAPTSGTATTTSSSPSGTTTTTSPSGTVIVVSSASSTTLTWTALAAAALASLFATRL